MTFAGLVMRNARRNRVRSVLTILAIAVAVAAFLFVRAAVAGWTSGAESAVRDRIITRHKLTLAIPLPRRYADDVARMPHVRVSTHGTWFGGRSPKESGAPFATVAVDHRTYFDVFDEAVLAPDAKAAWFADRQGAIVGDVLARRFEWKVGDRVSLESGIYPTDGAPRTFTIRGIYNVRGRSMDRSTFLFRYDYLNDSLTDSRRDRIGWILSRVDAPARAAETSAAIDRAFEERDVPTLSQDEGTFRTSMLGLASALIRALDLVSAAILLAMLLVVGNTVAMAARERTREHATLRAIGFEPRTIAALVLGEAVVLGAVGGVLGIGIAFATLASGVFRELEERTTSFFPEFRIAPELALVAVIGAALVAGVAAVVPAWTSARMRVVDALRREA